MARGPEATKAKRKKNNERQLNTTADKAVTRKTTDAAVTQLIMDIKYNVRDAIARPLTEFAKKVHISAGDMNTLKRDIIQCLIACQTPKIENIINQKLGSMQASGP